MDKHETSKVVPKISLDAEVKPEQPFKREKVTNSGTVKSLPWIASIKKVSHEIANQRLFGKQDNEVLYCLALDGSVDSDYAFKLITEDYCNNNEKLLCVYIFNSKLNPNLNYSNRKSTIVDKYSMSLKSFNKKSHFLVEDRTTNTHLIEQILKNAENYSTNFVVIGYHGLKGPKGDNKELTVGLDYLLSYSKIPIIIIKEKICRELKDGKAFKFLIILDKNFSNSYKVFNSFIPFINCEVDSVDFLELIPDGDTSEVHGKDWKEMLTTQSEKHSLNKITYERVTYNSKAGFAKYIVQTINYGKVIYDFVIFYNMPFKHKQDPTNSESAEIIIGCKSNVAFVNN